MNPIETEAKIRALEVAGVSFHGPSVPTGGTVHSEGVSKTPRTDAAEAAAKAFYDGQREIDWPPFDASVFDIACQLELELAEAQARIAAMREVGNQMQSNYAEAVLSIERALKLAEEWEHRAEWMHHKAGEPHEAGKLRSLTVELREALR